MTRRIATLFTILAASTLALACSSEKKTAAKKPATGQAATATTRKPSSTPAPQKAVASRVAGNQASAAKTDEVCTTADEGKGICVDEFVVFCSGGALYALDCAAAYGGTCGTTETELGCFVEDESAE